MRVTLIYNPAAGGGAGSQAAARAEAAFATAGWEPRSVATLPDDATAELARRAAEEGAQRVVAIGGDGTAVEVARGLLAAGGEVPMAHVPCGTANVLALNLGIPTAMEPAVRAAVEGSATRIDLGLLDGAPFLLSAGTGLHAEIVERADRAAKRRLGVGAYVLAGLQALGSLTPSAYRLRLDDEETMVEGTMVQVMNLGAVFRASWLLAPGISPIDGRLDVVVYRAATPVEYTRVAAGVIRGAPTETLLVLHRRAARIVIEAEPSVPVQRDGEPAGTTPANIEVRARGLAVVVPPGAARAWETGVSAGKPTGSVPS